MAATFRLEIEQRRRELVLDVHKVQEAMAKEAIEILHKRLPHRTGEYAESVRAELLANGEVIVEPTGERNLTIARVRASKGIFDFLFEPDEQAQIIRAGQDEIDRQIRSGEMRVEGR